MELNKHWKPLAEAVAHEKNLPVERIVAALGAALASLTLRKNPRPGTCKVEGLLDNQPQAWFQPEGEDHWEPMELPALTRTAKNRSRGRSGSLPETQGVRRIPDSSGLADR